MSRFSRRGVRAMAALGAVALTFSAAAALASSAQAAPTATLSIGEIWRLGEGPGPSSENTGEAQPQPDGYTSYVTFAANRLADGTSVSPTNVYSIPGDTYISVTVPADSTMPTQVYPTAWDASGTPTAFKVSYGLNEGMWHGGGFPGGSTWNADGQWVDANGQPTAFVGGTGGYVGGSWTAPVDGEKVTLIDKYYAVDVTKTFDDGGNPAGRIFLSGNENTLSRSTSFFAWQTGANGTVRGWWPTGWVTWTWEYLSPAEVAAGMRPVSMNSYYSWGGTNLTDPVTTVTLTAEDIAAIKANPKLQQATRTLVDRLQVGGVLAGPVMNHSTHPSTFNTITVVNHGTPDVSVTNPTIAVDTSGCVSADGSTPVAGTTSDAPDGSVVTITGNGATTTTTVTDDAFTAPGLVPDVPYTFTVSADGAQASVTRTFDACVISPGDPAIAIDTLECVAADGSTPVPGTTQGAGEDAVVTMTDAGASAQFPVTSEAFTATGVEPDVDYTFTVTGSGGTASITRTFPACVEPVDTTPTAKPAPAIAPAAAPKPPTGTLARTGANVAVVAIGALVAMGGGVTLVVARRRATRA